MSLVTHPNYPGLLIIVSSTTAPVKASAGAFYVTHKGKVLSHIALDAYGSGKLSAVLRINRSAYNQQHCVYRAKSTTCKSPVVSGSMAQAQTTWADGAWLALCLADRAGTDGLGNLLGTDYQVIWVPPMTGEEPWDLVQPKQPGLPDLPGIKPGPGVTPVDPTQPEEPPEPPKKAGFPWWLGLIGLGALVTVAVAAARSRKKKDKK